MEFNFRKLNVYHYSLDLVTFIYEMVNKFPKEEKYALCDQIRRAVVSVPSNIVEGVGRPSDKEKSHFIEIAYGSLMEAFSQLQIAQDLDYLTQNDIDKIRPQFVGVAKMLSGLKNYFDTNHPQ